jgi:hypothetical protein
MEVLMGIRSSLAAAFAASALALGVSAPVVAGPIPTMTAAVAQAAPSNTIDVFGRGYGWRGGFGWRGYGPGLGLGLAAGALAGAGIAAPYYGGPGYYYGAPMPYYSRPVYAAPYAYAPVYAPPVYFGYYAPYGSYSGYGSPSRCYTNEGYGRYRPCSAN